MDPSLSWILTGLLCVLVGELYRPWNKPNPYDRDDYGRFWGHESWRWTAVVMSFFRPVGFGLIAIGVLLAAVRALAWLVA